MGLLALLIVDGFTWDYWLACIPPFLYPFIVVWHCHQLTFCTMPLILVTSVLVTFPPGTRNVSISQSPCDTDIIMHNKPWYLKCETIAITYRNKVERTPSCLFGVSSISLTSSYCIIVALSESTWQPGRLLC